MQNYLLVFTNNQPVFCDFLSLFSTLDSHKHITYIFRFFVQVSRSMLSKKTKYAIKALVVLGKNYGKEPMQIARISQEEHIPKKFLEQILLYLRNAGLLYSKKGAGGGYNLSKDPKDIFLVQIMRITDGPIAMVPCVSLNFYNGCIECRDEATCGIRNVYTDVRDATLKILSETSIQNIIDRENNLIVTSSASGNNL